MDYALYQELESKYQRLETQNAALLKLLRECEAVLLTYRSDLQFRIKDTIGYKFDATAILMQRMDTLEQILTAIEQARKDGYAKL